MRIRRPLQPGVWHQHGRAQHRALQCRPLVWRVLRGAVCRRHAMVLARTTIRGRHGHQLLSAQLRVVRGQRRGVQPSAHALRHGGARVPTDRAVQGRDRAGEIPARGVPEERRRALHHQWEP